MKRTAVKNVKPNTEVKISGFVERIRDSKNMIFLVVKDVSGHIQVTLDKQTQPELCQKTSGIIAGSCVTITGKANASEFVKMGGIEIIPTEVIIESISEAMPINESANIDQRLDYRWIDLRSQKNTLIFKVQTLFTQSMREFLLKQNFIEMHSPKIISTPSESGADMFELDYFGGKAYLAQSPQFYKQMAMASGFEKVFEVGPVFRAEKSFTSRHTTEFTGFDVEFSYVKSHKEIMVLEEKMLVYALSKIKKQYGEEIKAQFNVDVVVPTLPFPRVSMKDSYDILRENGINIKNGDDFDIESERVLTEHFKKQTGHEFLFVYDYPAKIRAFYHMRSNGGKISKSYDLYWKGLEITTGAQREHRYEILKMQALKKGLTLNNIQFYLDFFRYGCPPHGGFGMGLDRLTMLVLNIQTIKEAMYIFRGPTRLKP